MTSYNEAIKWIHDTKQAVVGWSFGDNQRTVRKNISKNRDTKGIAESFNYQLEMILQKAKTNEAREKMKLEYNELQALLEKRRECLELLNEVTKMEDLFSILTADVNNVVLQLSSKPQNHSKQPALNSTSPQTNEIAVNCINSLKGSWDYLQSLAHCNQIHLENASTYHQFWHEVEESNQCLQYLLSQVPHKFSPKHLISKSSLQIRATLEEMSKTLKEYLQWQTRLDLLYERSKHIVPLHSRTKKLAVPISAQVLVDYRTEEFELTEGDVVTLVDNTDSKKWVIRIDDTKFMEKKSSNVSNTVHVPSIIILIPPSEAAALDAALRLRLQMLAIWSAASKRLGKHVTKVLLHVFNEWDESQTKKCKSITPEQQATLLSTLKFMENTLGLTEKGSADYTTLLDKTSQIANHVNEYDPDTGNHKATLIVQINYINKLLRRYWDFITYCDAYRIVLEELRQPKNVFIYRKSSDMRYMTTAHFIKNWNCDLHDKSKWVIELTEELVQAEEVDGSLSAKVNIIEEEETFDSSVTEQKTQTMEVMESEMEVETTFVITGVVKNPGEKEEKIISLQEAIDTGIIHPGSGLYVNRRKKLTIPIPQAMNQGLIKMGPKKEKVSQEKIKSAGIVTVRTTRETKPYTVIQALDTSTGLMLPANLALSRGILNPDNGTYKDLEKGTVMLIGDAVMHKLVSIEYDNTSSGTMNEEVTITYLVHAVVCQRTNQKLPFHEAVQKGIIDRDTGSYVHNVSGEKFFVVDAINKGFIKATVSDEPPSLHITQVGNSLISDSTEKTKRKLYNPLKALKPAEVHNNNIGESARVKPSKVNGFSGR